MAHKGLLSACMTLTSARNMGSMQINNPIVTSFQTIIRICLFHARLGSGSRTLDLSTTYATHVSYLLANYILYNLNSNLCCPIYCTYIHITVLPSYSIDIRSKEKLLLKMLNKAKGTLNTSLHSTSRNYPTGEMLAQKIIYIVFCKWNLRLTTDE